MDKETRIILSGHENSLNTNEILDQTLLIITEGITGIAASEKTEWFQSIGHLLQRVRSGKFISTFQDEWNAYREKGRVKDDYILTDQHQECLQELLDFLEQDNPDHIRFTILKKILLVTSSETKSNRDDILPQQYMKICRSLSSGSILILLAMYKINKQFSSETNFSAQPIDKDSIANSSQLKYRELIDLYENELSDNKLITLSGNKGNLYLTTFGYNFCSFIEQYDITNEGES